MRIQSFEFNLFGELTYLIWDPTTNDAAVIDPGMSTIEECNIFANFVSSANLNLKYLLYTHLHIDHTLGNDFIVDTYNIKPWANENDSALGASRTQQAQMFRLKTWNLTPLEIANKLTDSQSLMIGNEPIYCLHIPGHSPGSMAFYAPESNFVVVGDALFKSSIGRTDLPGGNHSTLINSIKTKLYALPDNTIVFPGHGAPTTIGTEKATNPFT